MSDHPNDPLLQAKISRRRQFQIIWLIPIVAVLIAAFLGWKALKDRGPMVTLNFATADGITAGQTKVRHKAVDLGTVESVVLSHDRGRVDVRVRMQREALPYLTEQTRFWVVRPRFSLNNVSGLDTLLSGAYIGLDPGLPGSPEKLDFNGLEEPPALRSDEPGRTFKLTASRIGGISAGSPLSYRDIPAGEVLGYELGPRGEGLTLNIFVRSPYDAFVHANTKFWNSSGVSVNLGATGVSLRLDSLQALLSGEIAFDTSEEGRATPVAAPDTLFPLYADAASAANAGYKRRVPFMIYFNGSVRGLAVGAPVETLGLQVGTVSSIQLMFDPKLLLPPKVAVQIEIQPERLLQESENPTEDTPAVAHALVKRGLRAQLQTTNYLTGQMVVSLELPPDAPADAPNAEVTENGIVVLPSVNGGFDGIIQSAGHLADTLAALPLEQIAKNLNDTLAGANELTHAPALRQSLQSLSDTLADTRQLVHQLGSGVTPVLKRLPELARSLQDTAERADKLVGSVDLSYGGGSGFKRDLDRLLGEVGDAARSVRMLADYLDQHPSALVRGRTGSAADSGDR